MSQKNVVEETRGSVSLSQAKKLGMVGSILVVLTSVPSIGGLLGIVGGILILLAIKDIADAVTDGSIFRNMLIATISAVAGVAVSILAVLGYFFSFIAQYGLTTPYDWSSFDPMTIPVSEWVGFFVSILLALTVVWVTLTISAVFVRRSFSTISSKLNVNMFKTAGLLYLIGAATTILMVGFPIIFVADILLIVAFFSMGEEVPIARLGGVAQ